MQGLLPVYNTQSLAPSEGTPRCSRRAGTRPPSPGDPGRPSRRAVQGREPWCCSGLGVCVAVPPSEVGRASTFPWGCLECRHWRWRWEVGGWQEVQRAEPMFTQTAAPPPPPTICFCSRWGLPTASHALHLKYPITLCVLFLFNYKKAVKAKGSALSPSP